MRAGPRVRIVALSDLHGFLPELPECDLLIAAGDVCPDRIGVHWAFRHPERQKAWFDRHLRPWLARAPAAHKILTWGNHDWCGQACDFRSSRPLHASTAELQILVDEATALSSGATSISIWASPWSNPFMHWAFMAEPARLANVYAQIPAGLDILVSHQPPYGYGDASPNVRTGGVEHLGSRELLAAIARVRPKLVVCGHIHEGHGRYESDGVPIYNVSVVDEQYRLVHSPTVIDLPVRRAV
jgi:hypothetical protein